jgi:L-threonylcarbamoyladenylate synthase
VTPVNYRKFTSYTIRAIQGWYNVLMKLLKSVDEAIAILLDGGVGVMPTDTVYGLVARAADEKAVARLYALKHREHKPGTIIAANIDQLVELGIKRRYLTAVEQWWPNPLSVIIPTGDMLEYLHQGLDSLAIRIPKDDALQHLLTKTGPLVTSSANTPSEPTAVNLDEAYHYFGDTIDFYIDGGNMSGRQPSTVVRVVDDAIEILRKGALEISDTGKINNV